MHFFEKLQFVPPTVNLLLEKGNYVEATVKRVGMHVIEEACEPRKIHFGFQIEACGFQNSSIRGPLVDYYPHV